MTALSSLLPYPSINSNGELKDGFILDQPQVCQRCPERQCRQLSSNAPENGFSVHRCHRGMSCVSFRLEGEPVVFNGIIVNNDAAPPEPFRRKQHRSHKVPLTSFQKLLPRLERAAKSARDEVRQSAADQIVGLHDIRTAVVAVRRNAESLIFAGADLDSHNAIENADPNLRALYEAIELLHSQLECSSIIANPAAAAYGQRRPTPIYRLSERVVHIFREAGAHKDVEIRMRGRSFNQPPCYSSIQTLLLVLIDNAVKYTLPQRWVDVEVNDHNMGEGVSLCVRSYGPIVSRSDQASMYNPGFRGQAARDYDAAGSGYGLYIADVIAQAHGTSVIYSNEERDAGDGIGLNIFSVEIPAGP